MSMSFDQLYMEHLTLILGRSLSSLLQARGVAPFSLCYLHVIFQPNNKKSNRQMFPEKSSAASHQHDEGRVPLALQAVFVASSRGKQVNQPPPNSVAYKSFRRKSFWTRLTSERTLLPSPRRSPQKVSHRNTTKLELNVERVPVPPLAVSPRLPPKHEISPHSYLGSMVLARGYSNKEFNALESAYFNAPTAYQKASHGVHALQVVRSGNVQALRHLLLAGLSPNACNDHGETIIHMFCRASHVDCLRLLLTFGGDVQVCDNSGRTPLHDVCWAETPSFDMMEMILDVDKRMLFLNDQRGISPLGYVRRDNWTPFTKFLMSKKDKYWPDRDFELLGPEEDPEMAVAEPNSRPLWVSRSDICLNYVRDIANGVSRHGRPGSDSSRSAKQGEDSVTEYSESSESLFLEGIDFDEDDEEEEDDDDDDCSSYDDSSNTSFDENEMNEILASIGGNIPVQWSK